ncbi:peptidylprolyl isomerase [Paracrocinitomix mangrovi]|uniref:peptidylprolyl isomerase n=1 Tax=Paracrocinitomix mangrovi TaxID=2862509 RepID=UPI001C8F107E|nr:peptidylprolyl isomerase [Paracrocinitomix mangrovi]UKN02885.1 peptidylprolyl isomerase [Paracrocinitomix mangrovi]
MKAIQSLSSKILAAFIVLVGISHHANAQKTMLDKIVAKVGDEYILYSDIKNQELSLLQNNVAIESGMDCEILEGLMYEALLTHQAVIDSVEVGDEVVNQEMESRLNMIAAQMPDGIKGLETFYGKSVAQIKAEFFEIIKKRMQAERMKDEITSGVDVTPKEVKTFYNNLPKDSIPYINSKVSVAQIVLYPELTEEDRQKAFDKIKASRERVTNGDISFKMEAFNTSDDPGSKTQGGSLGWQTRGTMVPEFEAELFKLEKGEISPIFETQFGYHYIQMIERKGDNYHVRHVLVSPQTDRNALVACKVKLDSIYNAINKGEISFEEAANIFTEDENGKGKGGKIINPYSGDYKWDLQNINEIDPSMSRFVDMLNVNDYSKPSLYDNYMEQKSGVRIVKLLDKTKPHLANLKDDYQLIQMAALAKKKQEVIDKWIQNKINANYIWVEDAYISKCTFKYGWITTGS